MNVLRIGAKTYSAPNNSRGMVFKTVNHGEVWTSFRTVFSDVIVVSRDRQTLFINPKELIAPPIHTAVSFRTWFRMIRLSCEEPDR